MEIDKSKIKILIVDDDVTFVNQLYDKLHSYGYDVSVAFGSLEAKALLFRTPFQIVFLDCLMPEMNGYTFAEEATKVFGSYIKFILMSNVFKKQDVIYMESKNIFSMLEKPIESDVLKREIDRMMLGFLNPVRNNSLLVNFFEENFSIESLFQLLEKNNSLMRGDFLPLFFYLLRSKERWNLKLSYGEEIEVQMVFKKGSIVHYETNEEAHAQDFLRHQNLFESKELEALIKSHGRRVMNHLIDHGLISPHHYFNYRKESLLRSLEYFTNQPDVQVCLEKGKGADDFQKYDDVEDIFESYFIENLIPFIQKKMNGHFFDQFIGAFEDYEIAVVDIQKLRWMIKTIPLLKVFDQKEGVLVEKKGVGQLCKLFPNSQRNQVYKGLFWLVSQGAISFKINSLIQLDKFYIGRYQLLYDYFKSLGINQLFQHFGCKDLSDKHAIQKTYHHYVKMNHVDKFQGFSENLLYILGQCNQIVSNAYDTVMSADKMSSYIKSTNSKEAENLLVIEQYRNDLIQHIKYRQYNQVEKLIQNMEEALSKQASGSQKSVQDDLSIWKFILEIERSQYEVDELELIDMEQRFKEIDRFNVSLDLYFYLSCLFRTCEKKYNVALKFCEKSLSENEDFDLAHLMKIKLNQRNKKSFGDWNSFLTDKKKSS